MYWKDTCLVLYEVGTVLIVFILFPNGDFSPFMRKGKMGSLHEVNTLFNLREPSFSKNHTKTLGISTIITCIGMLTLGA